MCFIGTDAGAPGSVPIYSLSISSCFFMSSRDTVFSPPSFASYVKLYTNIPISDNALIYSFTLATQGAGGSLANGTHALSPREGDEGESSSQRWLQKKQRMAKNIFGKSYIYIHIICVYIYVYCTY